MADFRIKAIFLAVFFLLISLVMTGCQKDDLRDAVSAFKKDDAIIVNDDLTIIKTLVDTFDESYYLTDELLKMITDEASDFNREHGTGSLTAEKVETEDDLVNVTLRFSDREAYAAYNDAIFFVGTIEEALDHGLKLEQILYDLNDEGKSIDRTGLLDIKDDFIIITNDHKSRQVLTVETFGKVLYVSRGIEKWYGQGSVRIADVGLDLVYVVFK
ncbi:MAG: hypothetical protein FWC09_05535 [Lachnospiraceae bacterium]|nr:hypothetical protein [Lachnospiraceae bacterium]